MDYGVAFAISQRLHQGDLLSSIGFSVIRAPFLIQHFNEEKADCAVRKINIYCQREN